MIRTILSKNALSSLMLGLSLAAAGCGGQLSGDDQTGVDETEMEGFQATAALKVPGKAKVYNTGGKGLNLRSGPSTGYGVQVTMAEGSVVDVVGGPQNSFYKVQYGGRTGG